MKRPIHLLMGHQFFHNHGKILSVTKCGKVITSARIKYTMNKELVTCGKGCGIVEKKIVVTNNPQGKNFFDEANEKPFVSRFVHGSVKQSPWARAEAESDREFAEVLKRDAHVEPTSFYDCTNPSNWYKATIEEVECPKCKEAAQMLKKEQKPL